MRSPLESLAQRLATDDPAALAAELAQVFTQLRADHPHDLPDDLRRLHGLLRFCAFGGIARWLRQERDVVEQALAFAEAQQEQRVAGILADALAGRPQPPARFTVILPTGEAREVAATAPDEAAGDGRDWSSTEVALGFALDGFRHDVLRAALASLRAAPALARALEGGALDPAAHDRLAG